LEFREDLNTNSIREGLDYVKYEEKLYVESITQSFLSYGFNDHFLSSKMFDKFHQSVEKHILNIQEETIKEYQLSHKQTNPDILPYDTKFLKWYLYTKCKIIKNGRIYYKIGATYFLGEFIEDFLKNKNFTFLDNLPVLSYYSKSFKYQSNEIIYWIFSHIFERQYRQFKHFFDIYNKIAEKFEKIEFKFAYIFWNYALNPKFAKDIDQLNKIINEYKLGEQLSTWDSDIDDLIEIYYPLFCKNNNNLGKYREIMDSIECIRKLFDSYSIRHIVKERKKSVYLGLMRYMISRSAHRINQIRKIPIHFEFDNTIHALALLLEKFQYIDNLAVFYELGCEGLEIFTLDEISQAVALAANNQGRTSLVEEWNFLKILIQKHQNLKSTLPKNNKNSNSTLPKNNKNSNSTEIRLYN
jgi:hypothetical protein